MPKRVDLHGGSDVDGNEAENAHGQEPVGNEDTGNNDAEEAEEELEALRAIFGDVRVTTPSNAGNGDSRREQTWWVPLGEGRVFSVTIPDGCVCPSRCYSRSHGRLARCKHSHPRCRAKNSATFLALNAQFLFSPASLHPHVKPPVWNTGVDSASLSSTAHA